MDRIELPVGGVTCGGCAGRVSKALMAVPGVRTAVVNDDRTMVAIEGAALERTTLIGAIEGAGYQVLQPSFIALGTAESGDACGGGKSNCC